MSILYYLAQGAGLGVAVAAPVGPIGMLCIRKTLARGLAGAVSVGLGAALADSIYGIIAATGLTAISHFLLEKAITIKIFGGLFLLYLAYKEMRSELSLKTATTHSKDLRRLTLEVFLLTLSNPMTILSFIALFASMSSGPVTIAESLAMVLGVFLGSIAWWLILGCIILKAQHTLPKTWITSIRYLSALILGGFGIYTLVGGLSALLF
jgi:putative LysE/RhtB family amino acid efflux pump